jgi:hypothetical protein
LHRSPRVDEALLDRTPNDASVKEALPEVLVPQVVVRVQLHERERTVHGGERPQLREQDRVVAAQAERRHARTRHLLEGGRGASE